MKTKLKWSQWLPVVCFFAFFAALTVLEFTLPQKSLSEAENRTLATRPILTQTAEAIKNPEAPGKAEVSVSVGQKLAAGAKQFSTLTTQFERYISDQFPMREPLVRAYSALELALNKKQARRAWCLDDYLLTITTRSLNSACAALEDALCRAVSQTDCPMVYCVLPNKNAVLYDLDPLYFSGAIELQNRTALLSTLEQVDGLSVLDAGLELREADQQQRKASFFKTDFHWNAQGAYAVSQSIVQALAEQGLIDESAIPADTDFCWQDLTGTPYQGDLNRWFSNLFSMYEEIPLFTPTAPDALRYYHALNSTDQVDREAIVGSGLQGETLDYNGVFTSNLGYYRVENPNAPEKQSVLILKDSYQNATLDYFTAIFQTVHVVDPRHYQETDTLPALLDAGSVDLILFFYHQNNISDELIELLNR